MKKKYRAVFITVVIVLLFLNIVFSFRAAKECMYDYLLACKKYWYCKWRIYDLKNYNDWETAWHIVHEKDDNFSQIKNIPNMKNNEVNGCFHETDDYIQDISGTIQCVDVWIYLKFKKSI